LRLDDLKLWVTFVNKYFSKYNAMIMTFVYYFVKVNVHSEYTFWHKVGILAH